MSVKHFLVQSMKFDNFEGLQNPIADSSIEIVQLAPHPVKGSLLMVGLGDFAFSKSDFSGSIRGSGLLSQTHFDMKIILDSAGEVNSFGDDVEPGDLICTPPGADHYLRFGAAASVAGIAITPADLRASFVSEPGLDDYAVWADTHRFRANAWIASDVKRRVLAASALLETHGHSLSKAAAEFWRRAILEAFATTVILSARPYRAHIPSPLRLVRDVERYVDSRPDAPVQISEISAALRVSRRTLHRAFHDTIGMGAGYFSPPQEILCRPSSSHKCGSVANPRHRHCNSIWVSGNGQVRWPILEHVRRKPVCNPAQIDIQYSHATALISRRVKVSAF